MAYEQLGDIYGKQRLGSFDGFLGDVASAQRDFDNAKREVQSAQESLQRVVHENHLPVTCNALPGNPPVPKIACPTTAGPAGEKIAAAQKRLESAAKVLDSTQKALESEKSAVATGEVLKGVGAVLNPLAQAGAGIFQAQQQASIEKARLKAQGGSGFAPLPMALPASRKSNLPLIIGGLAAVGAVVAIVVLAGGDDKPKARR